MGFKNIFLSQFHTVVLIRCQMYSPWYRDKVSDIFKLMGLHCSYCLIFKEISILFIKFISVCSESRD